jgi:hypothetical protein
MQSKKGKPRGRPWSKGTSGNLRGRPRGSKHKLTLMVEEGIGRAVEELSKPLTLDKSRPFEVWFDVFVQDGMRFRRDNLLRVNPKGPIPTRPEKLNIREVRQEMTWRGRRYWSQRGWLFDMDTHLPINGRSNK